ncbi:MAG: TetR family transcriptional regulator [Rhodococcus sp. (in: high G+C Gram-positive bacteria)]|uniref:TetR/AcrR family transcriptional regulator n=1 Tax=Rhodococcus sp. TaxID=1831 RepID=UPI003BB8165B
MTAGRRTHYTRGRERRDDLINAAVRTIARRGLERVTFRAVAEEAGFPPSTTSYFFDSVDDVIDAAITRVADIVTAKVATLLDASRSGELDAAELAEAMIDMVSGQDSDDSVAQFDAYLAARRRPELADPVHRIMRSLEESTENALRVLGVEDPVIAAQQFIALIDGFTLHEIARPGRAETREALRDLLVRVLGSYVPGSGGVAGSGGR